MSQDRTAVTKTFRWDLVIPHDKPKPYRKAIQCDCSTVYRQVCDACAGTPPLPILRLDPPWFSPPEISSRETFSNQAEVASTKERDFANVSATVLEGIVRWSGK